MSADNVAIVKEFNEGWYWSDVSFSWWSCLSREEQVKELPNLDWLDGPFETSNEATEDAYESCFIIEYGVEVW